MSYIVKPLSYVLVIALGYLLKRRGFLGRKDQQTLSKIMFNITLPCTIIQGFSGFQRETSLFYLVGIGFVCALLPMVLMYLTTGRVEKRLRAYRMLNIGGYNVGCFSLPLLEAFFGSACVVPAFMFDTGNAVMMTGGSYAMTTTLLGIGNGEKERAKDILLKFVKSLPFDTYMIMFAMVLLNIEMPEVLFTLTRPAGQANGFLAMLIIGLLFEPMGDRALIKETARQMVCRYGFAAVSAAACYFLTPFDLVVRQTLAVLCFAPLSSLAPIYTQRCDSDTALAGFTNSVSIAISLVMMMTISLFFVA